MLRLGELGDALTMICYGFIVCMVMILQCFAMVFGEPLTMLRYSVFSGALTVVRYGEFGYAFT